MQVQSPSPGEELTPCPNCRTNNYPGADICVGCGIRLDTYDKVNQFWQSKQKEKQIESGKILLQDANSALKAELKNNWKRLFHQASLIFLIMMVTIPVIWGVMTVNKYQEQKKVQLIKDQYKVANECFEKKDYFCSRDIYLKLLQEDKNCHDCLELLIKSRKLLAHQYLDNMQTTLAIQEYEKILKFRPNDPETLTSIFEIHMLIAGNYEKNNFYQEAIKEIEKALVIKPSQPDALDKLREVYELWYTSAVARGDSFQAWWIARQRNDRFAP